MEEQGKTSKEYGLTTNQKFMLIQHLTELHKEANRKYYAMQAFHIVPMGLLVAILFTVDESKLNHDAPYTHLVATVFLTLLFIVFRFIVNIAKFRDFLEDPEPTDKVGHLGNMNQFFYGDLQEEECASMLEGYDKDDENKKLRNYIASLAASVDDIESLVKSMGTGLALQCSLYVFITYQVLRLFIK
jgi:hypothetical protein